MGAKKAFKLEYIARERGDVIAVESAQRADDVYRVYCLCVCIAGQQPVNLIN